MNGAQNHSKSYCGRSHATSLKRVLFSLQQTPPFWYLVGFLDRQSSTLSPVEGAKDRCRRDSSRSGISGMWVHLRTFHRDTYGTGYSRPVIVNLDSFVCMVSHKRSTLHECSVKIRRSDSSMKNSARAQGCREPRGEDLAMNYSSDAHFTREGRSMRRHLT